MLADANCFHSMPKSTQISFILIKEFKNSLGGPHVLKSEGISMIICNSWIGCGEKMLYCESKETLGPA